CRLMWNPQNPNGDFWTTDVVGFVSMSTGHMTQFYIILDEICSLWISGWSQENFRHFHAECLKCIRLRLLGLGSEDCSIII
ncbi:hypothetical protein GBA52_024384, partial [Prunus armeniaca]